MDNLKNIKFQDVETKTDKFESEKIENVNSQKIGKTTPDNIADCALERLLDKGDKK